MWTRPLALSVLVGSVAFACGSRTDLIGSPSATSADAATTDATAVQDAGSTVDAPASVDTDAMVEGGAIGAEMDAAACKVPVGAQASNPAGPGGCYPNPDVVCNGCPQLCNSSQYELVCRGTTTAGAPTPESSLGCVGRAVDPGGGVYYCCPCEGADAGIQLEAGAPADAAPTCDPNVACGQALTCIGGMQYPTICGPANCDRPIGPCDAGPTNVGR